MKRTPLHLLLLAFVSLTGCIYKAPISLTPSREIDRSLISTWQLSDASDSKLIISEADPMHYNIAMRPPKGGTINIPLDFRAHHTALGALDIVNIQLIDPQTNKAGDWNFFIYDRPENDTLRIRMVNQRIVPVPPSVQAGHPGGEFLTTADAMKKHFENVINRADLFSKEMIYKRVPQ